MLLERLAPTLRTPDFRNNRLLAEWSLIDESPPRVGAPVQQNTTSPILGRKLLRPVPLSVQATARMHLSTSRLEHGDRADRGSFPETAAFLAGSKIVYAVRTGTPQGGLHHAFAIRGRGASAEIDKILREGLPDHVQLKINRLAGRIVGLFPAFRNDYDDLTQGFAAEALGAITKYNPARGSPERFMIGVLNFAYKAKLREIRRITERPFICGIHEETDTFKDHHLWDTRECNEQLDQRIDAPYLVAKLPPEDQALLANFMVCSAQKTAVRLGIHRGSVYRRITEIQKRITDDL